MNQILNINKKYKIPYIIANILLIFFDSIGIIIPIIIGFLVDSILIEGNTTKFLSLTIFIIIFTIVKYLGAYLSVIKLDQICYKIVGSLKVKCYTKLHELDLNYFEETKKGEILTLLTNDLNNIRQQLSYTIKTVGCLMLTFIWAFCYLMKINIGFTLILLTPTIIIGYASYKFLRNVIPKYDLAWEKMMICNDYINDNIAGNKVIKTFAKEKNEIKEMKKLTKDYTDLYIDTCLLEDKYNAYINFFSNFMYVIFVLVGGLLFIKNKITIGDLVIFNSYLFNLITPFSRLGELFGSYERYVVSKKRINKLLDREAKIKLEGTKPLTDLKRTIEFKDVSVAYESKIVLEHFNLTIHPGETIGIIGRAGSGKSTIASLLLGFIKTSSGELLLNDENYYEYNIKDIREKIGYVVQNPFLFSDTIYNNICYGKKINSKKAYEVAKIASCDYISNLPDKINTMIGERGVGLSGGEKQRLSLARALAVSPDLLLLDDITSALDIETEEKVIESINNLKENSTKIIIASKIVSVKNADKIIVLDKGKIIEMGTHEELLKKKGSYFELVKLQEEF